MEESESESHESESDEPKPPAPSRWAGRAAHLRLLRRLVVLAVAEADVPGHVTYPLCDPTAEKSTENRGEQ